MPRPWAAGSIPIGPKWQCGSFRSCFDQVVNQALSRSERCRPNSWIILGSMASFSRLGSWHRGEVTQWIKPTICGPSRATSFLPRMTRRPPLKKALFMDTWSTPKAATFRGFTTKARARTSAVSSVISGLNSLMVISGIAQLTPSRVSRARSRTAARLSSPKSCDATSFCGYSQSVFVAFVIFLFNFSVLLQLGVRFQVFRWRLGCGARNRGRGRERLSGASVLRDWLTPALCLENLCA